MNEGNGLDVVIGRTLIEVDSIERGERVVILQAYKVE